MRILQLILVGFALLAVGMVRVRAEATFDGYYRVKYRGNRLKSPYLAYKKTDCSAVGRSKVYLTSSPGPSRSLDGVWRLKGDVVDGITLDAANRQCLGSKAMYYKRTNCRSTFVGLSSTKSKWKIKVGEDGLATITSNPWPRKCKQRALSPKQKYTRVGLASNRGKHKWELIRCGSSVADCSSLVQSPPPSQPPPSPSSSPPDVQSRRCQSTTGYYSQNTHPTSEAVRQVCSALWDVDRNQFPLPNAGIGREITCRRESYELPAVMDWSINR